MNRKKRALLYRLGAVALLIVISAAMLWVGRGHTVYFDNKTLEYEGQSYPSVYRMTVKDGDATMAKLAKRERGMADWMGQHFEMQVEVLTEKGAEPVVYPIKLELPYGMDGIVVNLPGMVAGLPQQAWVSEFIPSEPQGAQEEELPPTEEDLVPTDI